MIDMIDSDSNVEVKFMNIKLIEFDLKTKIYLADNV